MKSISVSIKVGGAKRLT